MREGKEGKWGVVSRKGHMEIIYCIYKLPYILHMSHIFNVVKHCISYVIQKKSKWGHQITGEAIPYLGIFCHEGNHPVPGMGYI